MKIKFPGNFSRKLLLVLLWIGVLVYFSVAAGRFSVMASSISQGGGTVNAGTINQLAWYAATGRAVSGLATVNNGVAVTNGSGVPSISTTLPNALAMQQPVSLDLTNATKVPITLTTTGSSGPASWTPSTDTLNIPQYSGGGGGAGFSGTATLGTGAIGSGACATVVTVSATGMASTNALGWTFNADPTGVVGYQPTVNGMLTIIAYPTTNNANFKVCNNTNASVTPGAITLNWAAGKGAIASGTSALGTGAIGSGACATVVTTSASGTTTSNTLVGSFNGDPTGVTGYAPTVNGMLTIIGYPTANSVNWKACNNTNASVTPGAITLNWQVF